MGSAERTAAFAEQLRKEARRFTEEEIPLVVRATGIKALELVVKGTPVDTGHARANWQVSLDVPNDTVLDARDKAGQKTVRDGTRNLARAKVEPHIFLTNNVPYIEVLDDGRVERGKQETDLTGGSDTPRPRRRGASGSIQAAQGILNPAFDGLLAYIDEALE